MPRALVEEAPADAADRPALATAVVVHEPVAPSDASGSVAPPTGPVPIAASAVSLALVLSAASITDAKSE
jgi:hypothetical protein